MMKGLLGGGGAAGGGGGGGMLGKGNEKPPEGAAEEETEVLDDKQGNILLAMISQLRPGMDLSRITFPTFVLEPRSMLERITDFLSHPDLIFGAGQVEDANERFIQVLRYYLAGWHIKPKGVKKPYNPILGEIFRCRYKYQDGSQGFYIAEQVSHHPPISAFFYCSPENQLMIIGELKPKSKFLGNSAANEMGGYNHIVLLDRPEDGEYDISMPNMYARGILFGKMVLELGDIAKVINENNKVYCDVEFKTKGFFSGTYNAISGKVRGPKGDIGEISGKWSDQMYISRGKHSDKELMFDAHKATAVPKIVAPESEQQENESRRLWSKVTDAIKKNDQDAATDEKSAIEDRQRELARQREEKGEQWQPKYFAIKKDEYRPLFSLPEGDVAEQIKAVETWIFGTSSSTPANPASSAASVTEEGETTEGATDSVTANDAPTTSAADNGITAAAAQPATEAPSAATAAPTPAPAPAPATPAKAVATTSSNNVNSKATSSPHQARPHAASAAAAYGLSSASSPGTTPKKTDPSIGATTTSSSSSSIKGGGGGNGNPGSGSVTAPSSPDSVTSHLLHPFKKPHRKTVSTGVPDHAASSRHL